MNYAVLFLCFVLAIVLFWCVRSPESLGVFVKGVFSAVKKVWLFFNGEPQNDSEKVKWFCANAIYNTLYGCKEKFPLQFYLPETVDICYMQLTDNPHQQTYTINLLSLTSKEVLQADLTLIEEIIFRFERSRLCNVGIQRIERAVDNKSFNFVFVYLPNETAGANYLQCFRNRMSNEQTPIPMGAPEDDDLNGDFTL